MNVMDVVMFVKEVGLALVYKAEESRLEQVGKHKCSLSKITNCNSINS